jgi:hypothetical protein
MKDLAEIDSYYKALNCPAAVGAPLGVQPTQSCIRIEELSGKRHSTTGILSAMIRAPASGDMNG